MRLTFILLLFFGLSVQLASQEVEQDDDLIQFSGVAITADSLAPVPFATVMIKHTNRGTTTDYYGYFSFVAKKGDTLEFSSVGYKKSEFYVPDTLEGNRYSLIHTMLRDTVKLETVNIYPWPTPDQFKEAFLALNIPDDDLEIARKNLSPDLLQERAQAMPMTASMNFKWQMQQRSNQLYYAGQSRMNNLSNLLNPIAWAKFIEAWKNGDLKRDKGAE
ncbi:MAG: carboxypeptidase-like regulatory domain-containing protein [Vicingaceae bacterium]